MGEGRGLNVAVLDGYLKFLSDPLHGGVHCLVEYQEKIVSSQLKIILDRTGALPEVFVGNLCDGLYLPETWESQFALSCIPFLYNCQYISS